MHITDNKTLSINISIQIKNLKKTSNVKYHTGSLGMLVSL